MRLRARALVTEGGRGCVSFLFLGASGSLSSLVSVSGPTPSAGLLVVLSLTLFVANCETLQPRPQVSYLVTTYLCWGAGAVTLGAGEGRASGGRGGVSAGQGAEPGENTRQGFWPDWGGPPGRSASRDRAGPRAGFGVHQPIWPPPPGTLSYLNYVGMWGKRGPSMEQRLNHRRCVSQQSTLKFMSEQQRSDPDSKSTEEEPSSLPPQEPPSKPL